MALNTTACPYCGVIFDKPPQRKRRCPACRETVFVKYPPSDRRKRLMTAAQAREVEDEWAAHNEAQDVSQFCKQWDVDVEAFTTVAKAGGSVNFAKEAFLMTIADEPLRELGQRSVAARCVASIRERRGDDFVPALRRAHKLHLQRYLEIGFDIVREVEITPGERCGRAESIKGRRLTVAAAISEMPLPDPHCDRRSVDGRPGFCGCDYRPILRGDSEPEELVFEMGPGAINVSQRPSDGIKPTVVPAAADPIGRKPTVVPASPRPAFWRRLKYMFWSP